MRHGDVSYFEPDGRPLEAESPGLNDDGRRQAGAARDALAGVAFDRVIVSGLRRTVETAEIVAPQAELEVWPELEEIRSGRLEDIADEELERAFTQSFRGVAPPEARFLGGESNREFLDRVIPAVERLLEDEWDTVLAVLHGGVVRAILSYALTGERVFLGHVEMAAASISIVDVDSSNWIVRTVGYAPLDPLHEERATVMERYLNEYLPYRRSTA
jgi:probable phosphoglycerate mutase